MKLTQGFRCGDTLRFTRAVLQDDECCFRKLAQSEDPASQGNCVSDLEMKIGDERFRKGRHGNRLSKLLEPLCSGGAIQLPPVEGGAWCSSLVRPIAGAISFSGRPLGGVCPRHRVEAILLEIGE